MIKIAYLTLEQYDSIAGKHNTECSIFAIFQDDVTSQYYITNVEMNNTNEFDFRWVKQLELTDLPEHEYYKFKMLAS